ncbi:SAM-dependent methyltransferase [Actinoallomurus soli]|uniref:SAM-dependent methyltransferase n=1 Tax=Actinoallomurus soli TaxID=2952535 RepID=UPI0020938B73|nr:SAM-dependent methyltransferase [Actinoallomurus soli]MCO5969926.1 SAM-dependent methyltransferase [Actinoallomurus soli]
MEERIHDVIDVHTPSPARMYDYWLGGKDNFAADREAAEKVIAAHPEQRELVRANRDFLVRAVAYLAEQGIEQFLDLGTGIPTSPNVHEVAREIRPAARVVYVDNDPIVFAHNQAFRATDDRVATVHADIRRPGEILGDPAVKRLIDFDRPVGLLAVAVLHFVPEGEEVIATLRKTMAPGSFLALSTGTYEGLSPEQRERIENAYAKASAPAVIRSRAEIERLFTGFDVVDPGIVHVAKWRADGPETQGRLLAGVGRLGTSSSAGS